MHTHKPNECKHIRTVLRGGVLLIALFLLSSNTAQAAPSPYFIPSRTTGVAPLAVFFDTASSTSASTTDPITTKPFHELDYEWSFGDPAGGAVWTYGTASSSKNTAYGPEAAHVFEPTSYPDCSGTCKIYTVTMTVRNGTASAATSTTITVTDPDTVFSGTNTICFSTSGTYTGCPSGATQVATTSLQSAIAVYQGTNKRLLFRRGEIFTTASSASLTANGPGIIGAFGTGAKPILRMTVAGNFGAIRLSSATTPTIGDWRIMDLEIDGQSLMGGEIGIQSYGGMKQVTAIRVDIHHTNSGFTFSGSILDSYNNDPDTSKHGHTSYDQIAIVDSIARTMVGGSGGNGFFVEGSRMMMLGNLVNDTTGAEHNFRSMYFNGAVISNSTFQNPASTKANLTLRAPNWNCTTNCLGTSPNTYSQYAVVSDNKFVGGTGVNVPVNTSIDSSDGSRTRNIIFERNWWTDQIAVSVVALQISSDLVVARNNIFNLSAGSGAQTGIKIVSAGAQPDPTDNRIYNNTVYSSAAATNFNVVNLIASSTNTTVKNNLGYAPSSSTFNTSGLSDSGVNTIASYNSTGGSSGQVKSTSPLFASTTPTYSLTDDFKLGVGSYAIGTTTSQILGVLRDFGNRFRPSTPSIGAWDLNPPTVTTQAASTLAATTATLNGTITITGGVNSTTRGFAWGTNSALSGGDTATTTSSGSFSTGAYTSSLSSLTCNTAYYTRAYATNTIGTSYGTIVSFTTSACAPTLTTQSASSVDGTTATLNGTVTALGGANVTVSGFAYGTDSALATVIATTTDGGTASSVPTSFTSAVSSLTCNTAYYFRPYATNSAGTGLGTIDTFTTSTCSSGGGSSSQSGTITVTLSIINDNGGTKTASDFSLLVNDTPVVSGTPRSFAAPAPVYTVSASPSSGYTATFSGSCDDSGKISLSPGDFKTCTIILNDTASAGSSSSSGSSSPSPAIPAPSPADAKHPSGLTESQVLSVLSLLASFNADSDAITRAASALRGLQTTTSAQARTFTRDLQLHSVGDDVLSLQRYLNERGYTISVAGLDSTGAPRAGSPGNETTYFGPATYSALVRFQRDNNLPQTGFFGPLTREVVGR